MTAKRERISDEALMAAFRVAGDDRLFEELVKRHTECAMAVSSVDSDLEQVRRVDLRHSAGRGGAGPGGEPSAVGPSVVYGSVDLSAEPHMDSGIETSQFPMRVKR